MSISDLQFDTSSALAKDSTMSLQKAAHRRPFSELVGFVESVILPQKLSAHELENNACFLNTLSTYLHDLPIGPLYSDEDTSLMSQKKKPPSNRELITFSEHQLFAEDERYYEQIIFEAKCVPTRANYHDFFNGLIWCQFPKTKRAFNAYHIAELASQGSTMRSPVRDRLTHFDECGIVLFTTQRNVTDLLQQHQWQALFVEDSAKWHQQTLPVIFGHALWEMLLAPFIGLTAKATVIEVPVEVMERLHSSLFGAEFYALCDKLLLEHIQCNKLIETKKPWLPLPLLGIPHWSPFKQNQSFYDNDRYFMPKRN